MKIKANVWLEIRNKSDVSFDISDDATKQQIRDKAELLARNGQHDCIEYYTHDGADVEYYVDTGADIEHTVITEQDE